MCWGTSLYINFLHIVTISDGWSLCSWKPQVRGMNTVRFLTRSGPLPVVPSLGRVEHCMSLLCRYQWNVVGMLKPLARRAESQAPFCPFPLCRKTSNALNCGGGALLPCTLGWRQVEQSYSWAWTHQQCDWGIHFLIESHGRVEAFVIRAQFHWSWLIHTFW